MHYISPYRFEHGQGGGLLGASWSSRVLAGAVILPSRYQVSSRKATFQGPLVRIYNGGVPLTRACTIGPAATTQETRAAWAVPKRDIRVRITYTRAPQRPSPSAISGGAGAALLRELDDRLLHFMRRLLRDLVESWCLRTKACEHVRDLASTANGSAVDLTWGSMFGVDSMPMGARG